MTEYVLGFLFNSDKSRVVLIIKNRPQAQAGKLNGVGGKIEAGETPLSAMHREFREEAGMEGLDWHHAATLTSPRSCIFVYQAIGDVDKATTMTDERVTVRYCDVILERFLTHTPTTVNMAWLLPYLIDSQEKRCLRVEFTS